MCKGDVGECKNYPKVLWAEMGKGEVIEKFRSYALLRTTLLATIRRYFKEFIRCITTMRAYFTCLLLHIVCWQLRENIPSPPETTFQTYQSSINFEKPPDSLKALRLSICPLFSTRNPIRPATFSSMLSGTFPAYKFSDLTKLFI